MRGKVGFWSSASLRAWAFSEGKQSSQGLGGLHEEPGVGVRDQEGSRGFGCCRMRNWEPGIHSGIRLAPSFPHLGLGGWMEPMSGERMTAWRGDLKTFPERHTEARGGPAPLSLCHFLTIRHLARAKDLFFPYSCLECS